jgi:tetratricopeptide (TPR) repeat protein
VIVKLVTTGKRKRLPHEKLVKMKKAIFKGVLVLAGLGTIGILIFCGIYVYRNYPRSLDNYELTVSQPEKRVLIAGQGSEFKTGLIQQLTEDLRMANYSSKVIEIKELSKVNEENWDKIVLINSFIVKLNRRVNNFIGKIPDSNKVLLLVTAGGADWKPETDLGVDALTSASRLTCQDPIIRLIEDWVKNYNTQQWVPRDNISALRFFAQVDVSGACIEIKENHKAYSNQYPDLESRINQIGYYYLTINNLHEANEVFKLNTDLFPDRANVWDSYAESFYLLGRYDEAMVYYAKALELDTNLQSARVMINKLRSTEKL